IVSTVGKLRLYELTALLKHARLYVGPDAGPKHIAAAVRTPLVEITWVPADFPALSRGDPSAGACWRAWGTDARLVYPSRQAFERAFEGGDFKNRPIAGIDPDDIDRALDEVLAAAAAGGNRTRSADWSAVKGGDRRVPEVSAWRN